MHSPGLILARTGPTTAEVCVRPRSRWRLCRKTQSFWITASGHMHCLRESLTDCRKTLHVLFLHRVRSSTKLRTGSRNPASYTGRRGRRPTLIFGSHLILPLRSISPHSISELELYRTLSTGTVRRI
jgi:hypothetical protein